MKRDPWHVWFGPGRRHRPAKADWPAPVLTVDDGGPGVWINSPSGITISEHMLVEAIENGPAAYRHIFKAFAEVLPALAPSNNEVSGDK